MRRVRPVHVRTGVLAAGKHAVGHQPSTLRLILPECDLTAPPERIDAIHAAMRDALNVLHPGVTDGFVLLERTTSTGKRLGLVCCVDLERYRYDGAKTLIRPTGTFPRGRLGYGFTGLQ